MRKRGPKGINGGLIYAWACDWFRVFKGMRDGIPESVSYSSETRPDKDGRHAWDWAFSKRKAIPAEPQTLSRLLSARTRQDVISACDRSSWWLHPRYGGGRAVRSLRCLSSPSRSCAPKDIRAIRLEIGLQVKRSSSGFCPLRSRPKLGGLASEGRLTYFKNPLF